MAAICGCKTLCRLTSVHIRSYGPRAVFWKEHATAHEHDISDEEQVKIAPEAVNTTSNGHISGIECKSMVNDVEMEKKKLQPKK